MTRSLDPRVRRLEERNGDHDQRRQQAEDDAAVFRNRLDTIAAGYVDADRTPDPAAQAKWSPAMHLAWAMRFAPERAGSILTEYRA
ncbi:hypothetical protein [Sphingomonas sp. Leaf17]|uniref:hypothetical protein n=1 Tax=Sphingomonas sp. Leaf17 TaxID=1735683 RepID=UPI00138F3B84|nr:hypothetical protein [Sphingomonas sp. Leaf17]